MSDETCRHCGRRGAEAFAGTAGRKPGAHLCHPSDASLPDCCRRVTVWAEPLGALQVFFGDGPKPAGTGKIISAREYAEAYRRWRQSLPHDPVWNLIPRTGQAVPWECDWHGTIATVLCAECRREHAGYLERGMWAPSVPPPAEGLNQLPGAEESRPGADGGQSSLP